MDANAVFDRLIEVLAADSGGDFVVLPMDRDQAVTHIEALQAAGFFQDDPTDLDGSFWQAAAGEYTEVREYFAAALEHYLALDVVLNAIFERPTPHEVTA